MKTLPVVDMPKVFIDLHLHIDGALSPETALILADMQGVTLPTRDKEEVMQLLSAPADCADLNQYLECFDLPCSLMQTQETISEAVYRLCEELNIQGLIYAELRFAPQLHTKLGLTQEEVVLAAIEGKNRSEFRANLILCCMRGYGNEAANLETLGVAAKYCNKGVVAVDLAGAEALYATETYQALFAQAKELGLRYTIHAGEAAGADSVAAAVSFGASRIGHGVHSVQDETVMAQLREKNIPLELCITSNLQTKAETSLDNYPLLKLMEQGVIVTLNTDNPTVSNTTICREFELAKEQLGLTIEQVKQIQLHAAEYSFADEATKKELIKQIDQAYDQICKDM